MKKYKLIKKYPGSPNINTIIPNSFYKEGCTLLKVIDDFSEFWEEIIEKDYEILRLLIKGNKQIADYHYSIEDCTEISINFRLQSPNQSIYSIKRKLNYEIFTIGDKTNNGTISKFEIDSNGIRVFFEEKPKNYHVSLNTIKHTKTVLFRTEDGVDIFKNDEVYFVNKIGDVFHTNHLKIKKYQSHLLYFSTKEKAEEYILMNKPCLSINDFHNQFKTMGNKQLIILKELVKSKL